MSTVSTNMFHYGNCSHQAVNCANHEGKTFILNLIETTIACELVSTSIKQNTLTLAAESEGEANFRRTCRVR